MRNLRLFLAINLSPVEKQALHCISHDLLRQFKEGRVNTEDMYHITLHFFESVPEDHVEGIKRLISAAAETEAPFTLVTGKPGIFGSPDCAVVYVSIHDGRTELDGLHGRLEKLVAKAGFLEENRPYQPHITLGREIDTTGLEPKLPEMMLPSVSLSAHALTLLESKMVDGKPVYEPIATAEFKGKSEQ